MKDWGIIRGPRTRRAIALAILVVFGLLGAASAQDVDWKQTLEEGKQAAKVSGRSIFLYTAWRPGV